MYFCRRKALVAKLVDAPDLGSGVARRVGSSPIRRTFLADFPFGAHRKGFFVHARGSRESIRYEHSDRRAPTENLVRVFSLRRPLSRCSSLPFFAFGRKHKHRPTFEKSLGVFSLNSPSFTRAYVRARQSILGKDLHPSPPYPILLTGRHLRVKAFASSPPSPTRAPSSRSSPTFFEPSEIPDNYSPKR